MRIGLAFFVVAALLTAVPSFGGSAKEFQVTFGLTYVRAEKGNATRKMMGLTIARVDIPEIIENELVPAMLYYNRSNSYEPPGSASIHTRTSKYAEKDKGRVSQAPWETPALPDVDFSKDTTLFDMTTMRIELKDVANLLHAANSSVWRAGSLKQRVHQLIETCVDYTAQKGGYKIHDGALFLEMIPFNWFELRCPAESDVLLVEVTAQEIETAR